MPARNRSPVKRRVCVDTGGTFTDLIELEGDRVRVHKTLSTPEAPERAVITALTAVDGPSRGGRLVHGSTVGLNAVLTGRGARVALVTNAGFEDLVEIGRQQRPELYALHVGPRPTLVPRSRRFGIHERRLADGTLRDRATRAELEQLRARIRRSGAEAVAVCLLHSYAWPEDEERIARALAPLALPISVSSRLLRRHREFERFSTTLINAFVHPVVGRYLGALDAAARPMDCHLVRNEGDTIPIADAAQSPVRAILSGPAGGAAGARMFARLAGHDYAVGFDMGGTSADVAFCAGDADVEDEARLGDHVLALPAVPLTSVGTGGGSIAFRDAGGALRVGPLSAGADPGPACYGKGREPTVTDAHLVLGRLPSWGLLGGDFAVDIERARTAVGRLGEALGLDLRRTARGILDIADLHMARPLRAFTLGRGLDPADVCLVAFGGAGGLHALRLARLVGFREVLVPPHPGLLSAEGMLLAQPVRERESACVVHLDRAGSRTMRERARALLTELTDECGTRPAARRVFAAVRYRGNNAEFWVDATKDAAAAFTREFERRFGFVQDLPIECLRLRARVVLERRSDAAIARALASEVGSHCTSAKTLGRRGLRCIARDDLGRSWVDGPVAILDYSGTTIVETGCRARLHEAGCIQMRAT